MLSNKERTAAKVLRCFSFLEGEIFQLYMNLARKTEYADLESLLVGLAYDSFKHSRIVRELSKYLTSPDLQVKDCRKELGQLWEQVHEFSDEISRQEQMETDEFSSLLKTTANLEDVIGQTYSVFLETRNLQFITREISKLAPVNLETIKKVFDSIVRDKEQHRDTLIETLYFLAGREMEKAKDNTPKVKYQNPDAWSTPIET